MKSENEIKRTLQKLYDERFKISFNDLLDVEEEEIDNNPSHTVFFGENIIKAIKGENSNIKRIKLSIEIEKINAQIESLEEVIGYKYDPLKEKFKIS